MDYILLILMGILYLFDFIQLFKHPYRAAFLLGQIATYRLDGVAHLGRLRFATGGDGILFTTLEGVAWHKERDLLSAEAKLLHEVIADTPEEASAVHHIKMGWAPYTPMGEAAPCPHCGAYFYPESSGICPNCGPIC